jgi:protein ImuB
VGDECVGRAVLNDTHRPHSFHMEPFTVIASPKPVISASRFPSVWRQLRPPENISITLQCQRPKTFFFKEKNYIVERIHGPWLTGGDWWNQSLWVLEQWDIVARAQDGSLLSCCLIRDVAQDRWQMAALND